MAAPLYPTPPEVVPRSTTAVGEAIAKAKAESSASGASSDELPESPKTPLATHEGKLRELEDELAEATSCYIGGNPWPAVLGSAVDHPDDHLAKVVRSLVFAATHFGHSPPGFYQSSLPGTELMDGSIFIRAAGMTMKAMGWAHEGDAPGEWDRSVLGFDEAWQGCERLPGYENKGKGRMRSGTETEETVETMNGSTHPSAPHGNLLRVDSAASTQSERERGLETRILVGRDDEAERDRARRREAEEESERELMA